MKSNIQAHLEQGSVKTRNVISYDFISQFLGICLKEIIDACKENHLLIAPCCII